MHKENMVAKSPPNTGGARKSQDIVHIIVIDFEGLPPLGLLFIVFMIACSICSKLFNFVSLWASTKTKRKNNVLSNMSDNLAWVINNVRNVTNNVLVQYSFDVIQSFFHTNILL